ncbi:MAG TPA: beta-ketoacyl synthase N-terminal-like domain-containing protein, partial [Desulfobacterales bacterium]|nr:beta-ketoacyl synthase N-terminal-like domain-containing protein [Desulfobacterales bacterium]
DLIVVGTTTAGMHTTERLLNAGTSDPGAYRRHAAGSVAEDLAARYGCRGPVLTVSTACSSGAVAIKIALEMLRSGAARRALVGGADSLCRLTYYGFNCLQLIDPQGARPLDRERRGMSVAEGAGMLLLTAGSEPGQALAEVLGAGLSCDAYHPAAPHPEGDGAFAAMAAALADAGIPAAAVDYINLHGTGTPDNDRAEGRAIGRLFDARVPVSSIKGATGHSLAAAGAIEAVVAVICIRDGLLPANTGLRLADPEIGLSPVTAPRRAPVRTVLSNSFGFGGNNAAVVIGAPRERELPAAPPVAPLRVLASACVTGAGHTEETLARLQAGHPCSGVIALDELSRHQPARQVRRLKFMPRLALALADEAQRRSGPTQPPAAVFFGTGWGALSETHGFLTSLFETGDRFPSPTEFVGSVHNAPAGQVAIGCGATGANVTLTGEDDAFEQALLTAAALGRGAGGPVLVMGADEHHPVLSGLFDGSVALGATPSAGGAALLLSADENAAGVSVFPAFSAPCAGRAEAIAELVGRLGGAERIRARFGLVLAGIPAAHRRQGDAQLEAFRAHCSPDMPVVDYRRWVGEFASASAVAACLAAGFVAEGAAPAALCGGRAAAFAGKGCLVIGFGRTLTAVEVRPL